MPRIILTLEDGAELETELGAEVVTVGRHPESIIVLESGSVSSHHATIKRRGDDFYVQDLGTTNGTKLNGVEVEEAKLEHGDTVTFGDVPGVVYLRDEPITPLPTAVPTPAASVPAPGLPTPHIQAPSHPPIPMSPARRRLAQQKKVKVGQYKESTGCASFFMFVVFMLIAFVIGLHIRHYQETQRVLLNDIIEKLKSRATEGVEQAPAAAPGKK
jgi:pSer/pThr/pTyr-binding forkhead associated (FHA) protein